VVGPIYGTAPILMSREQPLDVGAVERHTLKWIGATGEGGGHRGCGGAAVVEEALALGWEFRLGTPRHVVRSPVCSPVGGVLRAGGGTEGNAWSGVWEGLVRMLAHSWMIPFYGKVGATSIAGDVRCCYLMRRAEPASYSLIFVSPYLAAHGW